MAETIVFPQDPDSDDAELFASLYGWPNLGDYVETGMSLQNYNSSTPSIDITTGKCTIFETSDTASTSQKTVLQTRSVVQIPAKSGLSLTDNTVNEIYVDPDVRTNDNGSYKATVDGVPSDGLKIGEVDTSADVVDQSFNRSPDISVSEITDIDGTTVFDGTNIVESILQNTDITITAGNQLDGGGTISLGDSVSLSVRDGDGFGLDADEIKGSDITVQQTEPSSGSENDIWVNTH